MKLSALLLALLITFLSVKSVVEPIVALTEVDACCKKDKEEQTSHHEEANESSENSCNEQCSPFQSCCPYITFSVSFFSISIPNDYPLVNIKFPLYNIFFHSSYSVDFWQPPKLV